MRKAKPHLGKHVLALGVELEGGWSEEKYRRLREAELDGLISIPGDGSVHCHQEPVAFRAYLGEVIPAEPFTDFETLKKWLERFYPQAVPRTWFPGDNCGFHIHISLRTLVKYQRLMCRKFMDDCYAFWVAWGTEKGIAADKPFWPRLRGESHFCQKTYVPDEQVKATYKGDAERYTGLNYCYGLHGTLELRLLPMFDTPAEGFEAAKAWVGFVEDWLDAYQEEAAELRKVLDVTNWLSGANVNEEQEPLIVEAPVEPLVQTLRGSYVYESPGLGDLEVVVQCV